MPVRPRRADDLPACCTVLRAVHLADAYPLRWPADPARWLDPDGLTNAWVGEHAGAIAGHVAVVGREVSRLFVDPAARGTGLARELLDAVVAAVDPPLVLEVVDGTGAVGFYERTGWRLTGIAAADWTLPDGRRPQLRRYALG